MPYVFSTTDLHYSEAGTCCSLKQIWLLIPRGLLHEYAEKQHWQWVCSPAHQLSVARWCSQQRCWSLLSSIDPEWSKPWKNGCILHFIVNFKILLWRFMFSLSSISHFLTKGKNSSPISYGFCCKGKFFYFFFFLAYSNHFERTEIKLCYPNVHFTTLHCSRGQRSTNDDIICWAQVMQ